MVQCETMRCDVSPTLKWPHYNNYVVFYVSYNVVYVVFSSTIIGFSALAEQFSAAQTINLMNCIYR